MKAPRLTSFAIIAILLTLAIAWLAPHQLGVTLYKLSLVTLAAVLGYWIDRVVFPYARPHGAFNRYKFWEDRGSLEVCDKYLSAFGIATLRRAILMAAVIIAIALGA